MSRKKLMEEMDAKEIMDWMAYEFTLNQDERKKLVHEISLEASAKLDKEQRAQQIINMFKRLK